MYENVEDTSLDENLYSIISSKPAYDEFNQIYRIEIITTTCLFFFSADLVNLDQKVTFCLYSNKRKNMRITRTRL